MKNVEKKNRRHFYGALVLFACRFQYIGDHFDNLFIVKKSVANEPMIWATSANTASTNAAQMVVISINHSIIF